jgi:hypothetical protein
VAILEDRGEEKYLARWAIEYLFEKNNASGTHEGRKVADGPDRVELARIRRRYNIHSSSRIILIRTTGRDRNGHEKLP